MTASDSPPAPRPAATVSPNTAAGGLVWLARALWLGVTALAVAVFAAAVARLVPPIAGLKPLNPLGWRDLLGTEYFRWAFLIAIDVVFVLVFSAVGLAIALRRSDDWFTLAVSLGLILYGITTTVAVNSLWRGQTAWSAIANALEVASTASVPILCYLFPDGRFVPRWTRWLALFWAAWALGAALAPALNPYNWSPLYLLLFFLLGLATGLGAQIQRYRRVCTPPQRQQTKWVVYGFAAAMLGFAAVSAIFWFAPSGDTTSLLRLLYQMSAFYLSQIIVPVCIGFSVLRYRLWDIDLVINRTIVYTIAVGLLGLLFYATSRVSNTVLESAIGKTSVVTPLASAVISAVLFNPLKERTQNLVDRRFYREKVDLQTAFAEFAHEIRRVTDEGALLHMLVSHVSELLHVVYGAVFTADSAGRFALGAAQNLPTGLSAWAPDDAAQQQLQLGMVVARQDDPVFPLAVPLSLPPAARDLPTPAGQAGLAASGLVAALALGPRKSGAGYSRDDRALLLTLADQVGTSIYVARTLEQKSRAASGE
jgi:hypothetical protein